MFGLSMVFLLSSTFSELFRWSENQEFLLTGFFAFFIFAAVFNAFNARTEKLNLFDNISSNKGFLRVIGLIVVIQVIMIYFGGVILRSFGLTAREWVVVLSLSVLIIPVDMIRKLVVKTK